MTEESVRFVDNVDVVGVRATMERTSFVPDFWTRVVQLGNGKIGMAAHISVDDHPQLYFAFADIPADANLDARDYDFTWEIMWVPYGLPAFARLTLAWGEDERLEVFIDQGRDVMELLVANVMLVTLCCDGDHVTRVFDDIGANDVMAAAVGLRDHHPDQG